MLFLCDVDSKKELISHNFSQRSVSEEEINRNKILFEATRSFYYQKRIPNDLILFDSLVGSKVTQRVGSCVEKGRPGKIC